MTDRSIDRIGVIRAESQRFADVLAQTPPDRRCPSCPDWSPPTSCGT